MVQNSKVSIEERVEQHSSALSLFSSRISKDELSDCYNRDTFTTLLSNIIESSEGFEFFYLIAIRVTDDSLKEIGTLQMDVLHRDIMYAIKDEVESLYVVDCGLINQYTMAIVSSEDISSLLKKLLTKSLVDDYILLNGMKFNVGGTTIQKDDALSSVLARAEFALRKTDARRDEIMMINPINPF